MPASPDVFSASRNRNNIDVFLYIYLTGPINAFKYRLDQHSSNQDVLFNFNTNLTGPYKSRTGRIGHTGQCMNHAPAILVTPALVYSTHQVLIVWIIVAHFHLHSLLGTLSRYTVLEV